MSALNVKISGHYKHFDSPSQLFEFSLFNDSESQNIYNNPYDKRYSLTRSVNIFI